MLCVSTKIACANDKDEAEGGKLKKKKIIIILFIINFSLLTQCLSDIKPLKQIKGWKYWTTDKLEEAC